MRLPARRPPPRGARRSRWSESTATRRRRKRQARAWRRPANGWRASRSPLFFARSAEVVFGREAERGPDREKDSVKDVDAARQARVLLHDIVHAPRLALVVLRDAGQQAFHAASRSLQ